MSTARRARHCGRGLRVAAVLEGKPGGERESSTGAVVGERDAFWFVLDDPAVDAFVVVQMQRPERLAELHDGDVGCPGEARHEWDAHVQSSAEWCRGAEHQAREQRAH